MKDITDFLFNNQDHFWLALAGIGAMGTLFVAYRALNTWNKEKKYDLDIENLAICNVAVQYIGALRYPASNTTEIKKEYQAEIDAQEFEDRAQRAAAEALYIYQSRRDRQQAIFEELLKLRKELGRLR